MTALKMSPVLMLISSFLISCQTMFKTVFEILLLVVLPVDF